MKTTFNKMILLSLFLTACATPQDKFEDQVDEMQKQIRQLKRERDAAREDYDADVSRAFRRDTLDRRFSYTGMPDKPQWQVDREREADEKELAALEAKQAAFDAQNRAAMIKQNTLQIQTPSGFYPVKKNQPNHGSSCAAEPVTTYDGKIVGYKEQCFGSDY